MIYGMDFSSLEEVERCGGRFFEHGKQDDLTAILSRNGINGARLRLWVDPFGADGKPYGAGVCDIECVVRLAKRAKAARMRFLLDFHYSDYWCDPAKQYIPKAWRGLELDELCVKLYNYTQDSLRRLKSEGVEPDIVQVGNEITNGFLWPVGQLGWDESTKKHFGFEGLCALLKAGTSAVRENSGTRIMLHLEDSGNKARWREWFDNITAAGIDYDIIGASYYPVWHGCMDGLEANLNEMALRYGKEIHIVETAYPFTTKSYNCDIKAAFSIGKNAKMSDGSELPFEFSKEGQADFIKAIIGLAKRVKNNSCRGIWYWEPAWLPVKDSSWASRDAREYIHEEEKPGGNEWANQCLFDYNGETNPAFYEFSDLEQR